MVDSLFDSSKETFARLSQSGYQAEVYKIASQKRIFTTNSHSKIHSLALGSFLSNLDKPKRKSRRLANKGHSSLADHPLLLVGYANGSSTLYDLTTQEIRAEFAGVHSLPITSLDISPTLNRVVCASEAEDLVSVWGENGEREQLISFEKPVVVKWSPDGTMLAIASTKIQIIDPYPSDGSPKAIVSQFVGHSHKCRRIVWSTTNDRILSFAEGDRSICIWAISKGFQKQVMPASTVIMCLGYPLYADISSTTEDGINLLVLTSKVLYYWEDVELKSQSPPKLSKQIRNSKAEYRFVGAAISDANPDGVIVVLSHHNGDIKFRLLTLAGTDDEIDVGGSQDTPEIMGNDTRRQLGVVGKIDAPVTGSSGNKHHVPGDDQPFSLLISSGRNKKTARSSKAIMLKQALQSGDVALLERVFQEKNMKTVFGTVSQLHPSEIYPFLKEISREYDRNPGAIEKLLPWIKALVNTFYSYIVSNPSSMEQLSTIYRGIEERLQNYEELVRLRGKLELLIGKARAAGLVESEHSGSDVDQSMEVIFVDNLITDSEGRGVPMVVD